MEDRSPSLRVRPAGRSPRERHEHHETDRNQCLADGAEHHERSCVSRGNAAQRTQSRPRNAITCMRARMTGGFASRQLAREQRTFQMRRPTTARTRLREIGDASGSQSATPYQSVGIRAAWIAVRAIHDLLMPEIGSSMSLDSAPHAGESYGNSAPSTARGPRMRRMCIPAVIVAGVMVFPIPPVHARDDTPPPGVHGAVQRKGSDRLAGAPRLADAPIRRVEYVAHRDAGPTW